MLFISQNIPAEEAPAIAKELESGICKVGFSRDGPDSDDFEFIVKEQPCHNEFVFTNKTNYFPTDQTETEI